MNTVFAIGEKASIQAIYKSIYSGSSWIKIETNGLNNHNFAYNAITVIGNTIILSAENENKEHALYRSIDKTEIYNLEVSNDLKIYPNPANDFIEIESYNPIEKVELISVNGRLLKSFKTNFERLNISNVKPGFYFLRITVDHQLYMKSFVKR